MTRRNGLWSKKTSKLIDLPDVATSKVLFNGTSSSTVIVDYDVTRFSSLSALVKTVAPILSLKNDKTLTSLSRAPDVQQIQEACAFIIREEQVSIASDFRWNRMEFLRKAKVEK